MPLFSPDTSSFLSYFDSGDWIEAKSDLFGLELIDSLVEQLDGFYVRENNFYLSDLVS